jgi:hypothetical protein
VYALLEGEQIPVHRGPGTDPHFTFWQGRILLKIPFLTFLPWSSLEDIGVSLRGGMDNCVEEDLFVIAIDHLFIGKKTQ